MGSISLMRKVQENMRYANVRGLSGRPRGGNLRRAGAAAHRLRAATRLVAARLAIGQARRWSTQIISDDGNLGGLTVKLPAPQPRAACSACSTFLWRNGCGASLACCTTSRRLRHKNVEHAEHAPRCATWSQTLDPQCKFITGRNPHGAGSSGHGSQPLATSTI